MRVALDNCTVVLYSYVICIILVFDMAIADEKHEKRIQNDLEMEQLSDMVII